MAHFYTGQLRLARLCVLRSRTRRPSVLFLRRAAPYKGLHPLRCFAAIPIVLEQITRIISHEEKHHKTFIIYIICRYFQ